MTFFFRFFLKIMSVPPEIRAFIFSFLPYNDLTEVFVVCKCFYRLSRKNAGFAKKLSHSRSLFSGLNVYEQYRDACLSLVGQLSHVLRDNFEEEVFLEAKEIIMTRFVFLPFRVWNRLFYCSRSHYCSDICLFCTRVNISHQGVSDYINKTFLFLFSISPNQLGKASF